MTAPETLPCPFCGNPEPKLICLGHRDIPPCEEDYYVACGKCRAQMIIGAGDRAGALRDWNKRPTTPERET